MYAERVCDVLMLCSHLCTCHYVSHDGTNIVSTWSHNCFLTVFIFSLVLLGFLFVNKATCLFLYHTCTSSVMTELIQRPSHWLTACYFVLNVIQLYFQIHSLIFQLIINVRKVKGKKTNSRKPPAGSEHVIDFFWALCIENINQRADWVQRCIIYQVTNQTHTLLKL